MTLICTYNLQCNLYATTQKQPLGCLCKWPPPTKLTWPLSMLERPKGHIQFFFSLPIHSLQLMLLDSLEHSIKCIDIFQAFKHSSCRVVEDCDEFKALDKSATHGWVFFKEHITKKPFNTAIHKRQYIGFTAGGCNFALYQGWSCLGIVIFETIWDACKSTV